jgi:hypothetical protein
MTEQLTATSLPYDKDQYALAEQLSQSRVRFPHDLANTAFDDMATLTTSIFSLGLAEAAPANTFSPERRPVDHRTDETIRTLAKVPLSELITLNTTSALDWQLARDRATLN